MAAISSTAWRLICKAAVWDPSTTASLSVMRAYLPMKHRIFLLWLSSLRPVQISQPDVPAHLSRFLHMPIEAVHLLNLLKACRCFNRSALRRFRDEKKNIWHIFSGDRLNSSGFIYTILPSLVL